jgi:hypothetical protein
VTTANQIIGQALGLLGIRSSADPVGGPEAAVCFERLNTLLDAWLVEPMYAYATQKVTGTLPALTGTRTIGPTTGDLLISARPVRLEAGCKYTSGGVDYPLRVVTLAEYEAEPMKDAAGMGPCIVHYNPSLPLGVLSFWPVAQASVTLSLVVQVQASSFADLTTDYTLPPGYRRALVFTLAEECGPDFERDVPATVSRNAANARRLVKRANLVVPQLDVCIGLGQREHYNILTG